MSMTLEEMKLAVCEKLPQKTMVDMFGSPDGIIWPTEGLQVCHEAEKLLTITLPAPPYKDSDRTRYVNLLDEMCGNKGMVMATYEQRLEALCRVWFPERF